jgi:alkylation response protein AidB-like acyl-CoA dehydrogenase
VQFGRPIGQNQGVAFQLADMRAAVDAARLLTWRAGWMVRVNAGRGSCGRGR